MATTGAGVLASGLVGLVLGGGASRAAETRVMDKLETELQDLQLRAIQVGTRHPTNRGKTRTEFFGQRRFWAGLLAN